MRLIHRPLLVAVLHIVSHPKRSLSIAAVLLVACLALAAWRLDISTDQNKLFDPTVPFFRDYLNFEKSFPENEALYVVIRPADSTQMPPVRRWTALADAIADRLRGMPQVVRSVDAKVPTEKLGAQGLLFDEPQRVRKSFDEIKRFIPLVKLWAERPGFLAGLLGPTPMERFLAGVGTQKADEETAGFVAMLAQSWNEALAAPDRPLGVGHGLPDLAASDAEDPSRLGYYYVPDETDLRKRLLLVRVYKKSEFSSLTAVSESVDAIRSAALDAARPFPEFKVGFTGRPALEADEMRTTDRDSHRAEVVALIAVFIGLVVVLRSVWLALAGEIALGVGIGWTFGWATITVGELNLLSIVFLLALIGIGMDYLVQVLTRYRQELSRRSQPQTIWTGVFHHVALPINTACMGAAGAFLVSTLTQFRGAAQLGIIAGGGLLLCLISGYVVLPALLTLFPPRRPRPEEMRKNRLHSQTGRAKGGLIRPAVWIGLLMAGIPLAQRNSFDPALLKMQARNLESVQLINRLQTWSAVVLSNDLDVLRKAQASVTGSPLVARTESILMAHENLAWLAAHESELPSVRWTEPAAVAPQHLGNLARKSADLAKHFAKTGGAAAEELNRFARTLSEAKGSARKPIASRLSAWQHEFVGQLRAALAPFHPAPLDPAALPIELRSHYVGTDGRFALYIYPTEDLWNHEKLIKFASDVETRLADLPAEATLTGIVINIHHSTAAIERAFYESTAYALALIFVLVFIDFRRISLTLLAISVLALGLPMLAAGMGLLDWLARAGKLEWLGLREVTWNFANFFGLPILIGAGHEYGVFLVHRYREAVRDPRRVWRRGDVSDRALALCAYVTCSSFGFFFLLAHHQGLRSLGLVMTLGTACIYLAAVVVLRPMLLWRLEKQRSKTARG